MCALFSGVLANAAGYLIKNPKSTIRWGTVKIPVFLSEEDERLPIFLQLEAASQQNMYHATAWYGERVNLSFITPTSESGWKATEGTEIEFWEVGYYDLLARRGSKGISITLNNPDVREYTLKWKHLKRPDGGEPEYTVSVKIGDTTVISQDFTAPSREREQGGEDVTLNFALTEHNAENAKIIFMPKGTGTSGPLIGAIELEQQAMPDVKLVSETQTGLIEGPYEIDRTTITLSGEIAEGCSQVFALSGLIEINNGNLIEATIETDDFAAVTMEDIGVFLVSDDVTKKTGGTEWEHDYEERKLPFKISYINKGGDFNLSIVITVKRSLRELFFYTKAVTGEQFAAGQNIEDAQAFDLFVRTATTSRTRFGVLEHVVAKVRNRNTKQECELPESCSMIEEKDGKLVESELEIEREFPENAESKEDDEIVTGVVLKTAFTEDKTLEIVAEFEDGDIVSATYDVCIPKFEAAELVTKNEYENKEFDPYERIEKYRAWARKCFLVYVYPMDVSFEGLAIYEVGCAGRATGIFSEKHSPLDVSHFPSGQSLIRCGNYWGDVAAWGEGFTYEEVLDIEESDGHIGTLIWDCPVRWQFKASERDRRTKEECLNSGIHKNEQLSYDGILPTRVQTMRIKRDSETETLSVLVEKIFPQP